MIKIQDGTRNDTKALCRTCQFGLVTRGAADSAEFIHCGHMGRQVLATVVECNRYADASIPSIHDMYQIAWILETSKNRRVIGFASPQEWAEKSRNAPMPTSPPPSGR